MKNIVECVPNFSEGRNTAVIQAIAAAVRTVQGVMLLGVEPDKDYNRTVVTLVGDSESIVEAAFQATKAASERIDMTAHAGEHPRIGATDVVPFIPVSGITMEECVRLAEQYGDRVGRELNIPVYLYEAAARTPQRKNLADIRKGEYEGLADKLRDPAWIPDFGPAVFNARSGATVAGARKFLIAYNVNLNTPDQKVAHEIAVRIRESGRPKKGPDGKPMKDETGEIIKIPGTLKAVKAMGVRLERFNIAQVSINLVDFEITSMHDAFEEVKRQAVDLDLKVTGSELVGLTPLEALLRAGRYYAEGRALREEELVALAVERLGLSDLEAFKPEKKVIEYQLKPKSGVLVSKTVADFLATTASNAPAPGGGSVSALAASLGAALTSMVCQLTIGKKKYAAVQVDLESTLQASESARNHLTAIIDEDTAAFNMVMAAFGLPKETEEQKLSRAAAIQRATKTATLVPLRLLRLCSETIGWALVAAEKGNTNSISDAGVAGAMLVAASEGARLNVLINLGSLEDKEFCAATKQETEQLAAKVAEVGQQIRVRVSAVIG